MPGLFTVVKSPLMFVGLNPSTADEHTDDNTIRRLMKVTQTFGYTQMIMTNLFAFRATDPKEMKNQLDPVGPDNDQWLSKLATIADKIIICWGNDGGHRGRSSEVLPMLRKSHLKPVYCFGTNGSGEPKHPLYLPDIKDIYEYE